MSKINELQIIEDKYAVEQPNSHGFSLWPLLRQSIYIEIFTKKVKSDLVLRTRNKAQLIKNFLYGISYIFKLGNFNYVFFNNADKRTLCKNNKKYDVFFDAWADKLGQDKSLFIEWAINAHYPKTETYSKHVMSDLIFKLISKLFIYKTNVNDGDYQELEKIVLDHELKINLKATAKTKIGSIYFYKWLFNRIKPKAVFLISSFTKEPIVIAAHLCGIKVYEAQHGFIGNNHQFYKSHKSFDKKHYPDFLISFGEYEKNNLPKGFIFKKHQIMPTGSLYLENIKNNYTDEKLKALKNKYNKIFCVTLQTVLDHEFITWVHKQCDFYKESLFVLAPRNKAIDYSKYLNRSNCVILEDYNIYQILKYSDYNITIYSTTAIEASVFNAFTLFYNLNGLSSKYFDVTNMS